MEQQSTPKTGRPVLILLIILLILVIAGAWAWRHFSDTPEYNSDPGRDSVEVAINKK